VITLNARFPAWHPRGGLVLIVCFSLAFGTAVAAHNRGVVATVQPVATQEGLDALKSGGNAIDAAIACALTLGVVDGHDSGLGGGCLMLIRLADGRFVAIDGRETAPAAATRGMFLRDGRADPQLSLHGALAPGVPGELAALAYASTNFGRLPLRQLLESAARVAEQGFAIDGNYANKLREAANDLSAFKGLAAEPFAGFHETFQPAPESPWPKGHPLAQPDLAATLRHLATDGPDWFYRGDFARRTGRWMRSHGGLLTAADFAAYRPKLREPVRTTYRGCEIVGFPPPSSGGVHVAQILNMLEHFDLKALGEDSADFVHVVAEAMKLAFADRAHWLGDPDFVKVPRGLAAKEYATTLAKQIRLDRVANVEVHGTPPGAASDVFGSGASGGKHTTHFSTADAEGNWVACTATINTAFGSKVVVPGTGVLLNNQMNDFSAQPGVPNYFGLVGAEANSIAPGKRPLSSMSPTIVLRDGRPILAVGAAGGPTIISQTVLAIIEVVDFGRDPASALARPRFHHQWKPEELKVERSMPEAVRRELERRGHKVVVVDQLGAAQAVGWDAARGAFTGASDPRGEGRADGW
jgi:gamma-glutamyltranspeptidase/glutathione hydrolase